MVARVSTTRVSRRFSRVPKQRVSFTCVRVFRDIGSGVCAPILDFMLTQRCPWTAYFWGKTHIGAVLVAPIIVFKGLEASNSWVSVWVDFKTFPARESVRPQSAWVIL